MKIETLIVDDESAARSRLRKMLADFPQIIVAGEAHDGVDAVKAIRKLVPDLIFLDVQMPGLDGFEVLRSLPPEMKWPLVIFATAFDRYAMAAFEEKAVGYLLKPINREKLGHAIERAEQLLSSAKRGSEERSRLHALTQSTRVELRHAVGRHRDRYLLIPIEEACFFKIEDGIVKVKTRTTLYRTDYALADLEERLPNPPFFRAHRSVIVNSQMVAEIAPLFKGSYSLVMKDQERSELQVSDRQSKLVRELLQLPR